MKHSPEPWMVGGLKGYTRQSIVPKTDEGTYASYCIAKSVRAEDADRIVAAVNACAGIPTEQLIDPHQCLLSMADFAVAELMQSMEYEGDDKDFMRFLYMVRGCIKNMAERTKPSPVLCVNCQTVIRKAEAIRWEEWKLAHPERYHGTMAGTNKTALLLDETNRNTPIRE